MKIANGMKVISPKGIEYTVIGIEDNQVIVSRTNKAGEEVIKEFKKSTVTKTWKPSTEESKTLVEEALEEAGLNSKVGKIGDPMKDTNKSKKAPRKDNKGKLEGVITLKDILESLGISTDGDNMKMVRRKIRKNGEVTKSKRLEGYTYSFKSEDVDLIVKELKNII